MPFADCAARSFTIPSVRKNAPELSGVYGLSNAREWLFVGQGNNIRAQLLEHLNEVDTALMTQKPKGLRSSYAHLPNSSAVRTRWFANLNLVAIAGWIDKSAMTQRPSLKNPVYRILQRAAAE